MSEGNDGDVGVKQSEGTTAVGQKSSMTSIYFMVFFLLMIILFIPGIRTALGVAAGVIFNPLFAFNGQYPLYTILSTGVVLTLINVWARHHYTDWIKMAKSQAKMKAFNQVYREAMRKQDLAKIEKLKKKQMEYMSESMETQSQMMKATMITLLIVIAIFTWLWTFMQYIASYTYMAVPWSFNVDMNSSFLFPWWLWLYSGITMPLAWVVQYIFKYFEFTKKLEELGEHEEIENENND